jgi:hypothetical protein
LHSTHPCRNGRLGRYGAQVHGQAAGVTGNRCGTALTRQLASRLARA